MIYLDNAATSFPKPYKVCDEVYRCMMEYCANPGRGGHSMSIKAGKAVYEVRETISDFFNFKSPLQLSFMKNATEGLNTAIKGWVRPGDHVITTCMEHNSVIRPLKTLEKDMGVELTFIKGDEYGEVKLEDIKKSIKENTRLIVTTLSSNVNGIIMPIKDIGEIARVNNIPFLVDASQGAGVLEINVQQMNIDMLVFPGHKSLLGPQGIGGLYVNEKLELKPIIQGGTGSNSENVYQPDFMPDLLESGTLNTPGIIGLGCGINFIRSFGMSNLKLYKHMLLERLHLGIKEIEGIKLYSKIEMEKNSGIIALNIRDIDSTDVSYLLDKNYGIATRAGLHCAPMAHETLGTMGTGLVRISIGCFNTIDEIDFTIKALKEIAGNKIYL